MPDNVNIVSVDQSQIADGITIVNCNVLVATATYPQTYTISAVDAVNVQAQVLQQSEITRSAILNAGAGITSSTTLANLVGTSINL